MRSIDCNRPDIEFPAGCGEFPASLGHRFEELRTAYLVRLADDRARLEMLLTRFCRPHAEAAGLYNDIQRIAHGMAGAAAIFNAPHVGSAARRLEEAAAAAAKSPDSRTETVVRTALGVLLDLLPVGEA
jgi:HPt (histidine-containing phosphotransfer) domain-containing protein